ncbi:MAG TPA: dynamin family protein [Candidatus Baltobacteraceae bacterium]|nr:dynamin family protein [Candidatus Baltobacteraceae bacterium]
MDEHPRLEYRAADPLERGRRHEGIDGAPPRRDAGADSQLIDESALARYDEARRGILENVRALEDLAGPEERPAISAARARLERSTFTLAVVGEFSSGKSFLLNALLGQYRFEQIAGREQIVGLLATDINPSTATITELEYAPQQEAYAHHEDGRIERVPIDRLSHFVAVDEDAPTRVVVKVDSEFLRRGFIVADTPGLASINPAHRRATLQFLPSADAVLYLIDTQQPFTEGDASFLGIIRQHLDTIFIVQTKIDLWEQLTHSGIPEWEAARNRIAQLAAIHAPQTYVYALSARTYVEGRLRGDRASIEQSRFEPFVTALDASLVRNTGRARLARAAAGVRQASEDAIARIDRDLAMLSLGEDRLRALRNEAQPRVDTLQTFVAAAQQEARGAADRTASALEERGKLLADDAERALGQAFDITDVARLRDRPRLHILVDRVLGESVEIFAREVAAAVASDYAQAAAAAQAQLALRFSFGQAAASAFGSSGQNNLWSEQPDSALAATIVLEAIGGPAISLVESISSGFASAPQGTYMKRELIADLRAHIWPRFRGEMAAFSESVSKRICNIAESYVAALDEALSQERDRALGSIDRALAVHARGDDADEAARAMESAKSSIQAQLQAMQAKLDPFLARGEEISAADPGEEAVRRAHAAEEFDRQAYELGLRPQRWRVAILGALRRGKSSLINAFAGRRVLADEVAGAIAYPVHVRYGEQEEAFALQSGGSWREIEIESALEEATRNPVLILTPWKLPRELVLVHAPAFDAGDATLEDVCMVAAGAASEVLCLFSRQLSDRELALYQRVAESGKPMMFAHTLADNESPAERRHVVELAQQYLRERNIPSQRVFTVSTLEYAQAKKERRAPAGWNELDALISTITAHAEEHMARLERLERAAAQTNAPASPQPGQPQAEKPRGLFARLSNLRLR